MKSTNKDSRITVRLTPNQQQVINEVSAKINRPKAALVRCIIDNFITKYNKAAK